MLISPKEMFKIYPIININLILSNNVFYILCVLLLIISLYYFTTNDYYIIPTNYTLISESFYYSIQNKINKTIKKDNYQPLLLTIFHFIFISNLIGIIPYSTTPTVEFILTLFISISIILGLLIYAILKFQFKIISIFLPSGTPNFQIPLKILLEIIALKSRIISLGQRLAINLIVGHLLLKILTSALYLLSQIPLYINNYYITYYLLIIPKLFIILFIMLEQAISYIQAYIFMFIIQITKNDISLN